MARRPPDGSTDISTPDASRVWPYLYFLPAEIKNQIYTYVFASITYKIVRKKGHKKTRIYLSRHSQSRYNRQRFALLYTCRQIYGETKALPVTLGTFKFTSMVAFLNSAVYEDFALGPQGWGTKEIRNLHLRTVKADLPSLLAFLKLLPKNEVEDAMPGLRYVILDFRGKLDRTGGFVVPKMENIGYDVPCATNGPDREPLRRLVTWFKKGNRVQIEWRFTEDHEGGQTWTGNV
ncbi:hypothetical protein BDU57DRAFT_551381 [Ampelomyces quisqualis]|uniref:Uncharacterized protein n=1 Tax=Ampelomyces quisqualis TaxID=50730 RepID=A0A6A5QEC3_AMPQU|nr:hypothetical protein BDU57DRAFT_551381 [Ampelomyces quisqualis]